VRISSKLAQMALPKLAAGWGYGYFCCLNQILKDINRSFHILVPRRNSKL